MAARLSRGVAAVARAVVVAAVVAVAARGVVVSEPMLVVCPACGLVVEAVAFGSAPGDALVVAGRVQANGEPVLYQRRRWAEVGWHQVVVPGTLGSVCRGVGDIVIVRAPGPVGRGDDD